MTLFIDSTTLKRVNIYAPYKDFSKLDTPEIRARAGVIEIADPTPPQDYDQDFYFVTEQDDAPYTIFARKTQEQIDAVLAERARIAADAAALEYAVAHPVIEYLATHTPSECEAYVETNVIDLATAKTLLKQYAIALCVLARKEFRP